MKNVVIGLIVAAVLIGGWWFLFARPSQEMPGMSVMDHRKMSGMAETAPNTGSEVVQCPVMGTQIAPQTAYAKTEYKGKTYYFCCAECPEAFKKNPEKYAK